MPGNSQRKGAVRKTGKGIGPQGRTAGSGGRSRRALEGKGPTPKAEERPYHKAYKSKQTQQRRTESRPRKTPTPAGVDWIVGRNAVLEALQAGLPVRTAFVAEGAERDDRLREILRFAADNGLAMLQVTRGELDRLTGGAVHQGVGLQLPAYEYAHPDDLAALALETDHPLLVALDQITDPHNLGAIIRSAAAFGAQGVVIPERRSAQLTAVAWKASSGAAARIPVAKATNLNRALRQFADDGFTIIGLAGEAGTDIADVTDLTGPVVLVVGSEGDGLARLVSENCDHLVRIPISSTVESLNASVAAAIALYELARARG